MNADTKILHDINAAIASVRDSKDLFTLIFGKIKPFLHFDSAVVVLADEDLLHTQHMHADTDGIDKENHHYKAIMSEKVPIEGTPYEEFLFLDGPEIIHLKDLQEKYPDHVDVKTALDFGLLEHVFMPLNFAGRTIGTLEFHAKEKGTFSESNLDVYSSLANQIAVAISNILANEEIQKRQEEKEILLSLSKDIALVRNKEELWHIISEKLQPIFGFQDAVVIKKLGDYHHHHILVYSPEDIRQYATYQHVVDDPHLNEGTTWNWQLSLEGPHIFLSKGFNGKRRRRTSSWFCYDAGNGPNGILWSTAQFCR